MREHWKALTALGVVIIVVVIVVIIMTRPATPAPETKGAGKLGFPVSDIRIGEGGSRKAGDGKTPIGYDGSCNSAIQAAANYAPLLRDFSFKTWAVQKKTLTEVSKPGEWFKNTTFPNDFLKNSKELPPGTSTVGFLRRTDVAAGGMYRVGFCKEKEKAVVQVFAGSVGARVNAGLSAGFETLSLELSWDGDWKITDSLPGSTATEDFGGKVKDIGPYGGARESDGASPTLTASMVDDVFKNASREGWVEYANAKR